MAELRPEARAALVLRHYYGYEYSHGSAGVFAFDVGRDQPVERWPATADFVSLAVSGDGRFVYAAGIPGVDASGRRASQPASITVYDSATGDVRLIAGSLSQQMLTFPATVLP